MREAPGAVCSYFLGPLPSLSGLIAIPRSSARARRREGRHLACLHLDPSTFTPRPLQTSIACRRYHIPTQHNSSPPVTHSTLCIWLCHNCNISTTPRSCCPPYTCIRAVRSKARITVRALSSVRSDKSQHPVVSPYPQHSPSITLGPLPTNRRTAVTLHHADGR